MNFRWCLYGASCETILCTPLFMAKSAKTTIFISLVHTHFELKPMIFGFLWNNFWTNNFCEVKSTLQSIREHGTKVKGRWDLAVLESFTICGQHWTFLEIIGFRSKILGLTPNRGANYSYFLPDSWKCLWDGSNIVDKYCAFGILSRPIFFSLTLN